MRGGDQRVVLVDASVFITLTEIGAVQLLQQLDGEISMPGAVIAEISAEPAATKLETAVGDWIVSSALVDSGDLAGEWKERLETAATHLDAGPEKAWGGDVPLLAAALYHENPVVVTDDKPLRKTCKALSIPVSGSIGVLIRGVETGSLDAEEAKRKLVAMDEVGARLSVPLLRRAESMIDNATQE